MSGFVHTSTRSCEKPTVETFRRFAVFPITRSPDQQITRFLPLGPLTFQSIETFSMAVIPLTTTRTEFRTNFDGFSRLPVGTLPP